jgi:hypothetical protein
MICRRRLHRIHPLAAGTHVSSAQLRLLVHAVRGDSAVGGVLVSLELFVAAAFEVLADMEWGSADASVPIQRSNGIRRAIRSYLIVRVRYDTGSLDGMGALLWRAKLSVLLVVEQAGRVWRSAGIRIQRLHVLLRRRRHRLHGVGVGGPSLVNLVRVHDRSVPTFPERLLKTDSTATASLTAAPLRDGHSLGVNGLFNETAFVVRLLAADAIRLASGVGDLVGGVVRLTELVDRYLRGAEALRLAPSLNFISSSNGN